MDTVAAIENYSEHRLNSVSELNELESEMGSIEYAKLVIRIFKRLNQLKPGEKYDLTKKVMPQSRRAFIKIACSLILVCSDFEFNNTYTTFRRMQS